MHGQPFTQEIDEKILELYKKHYTNKAIATIVGRTADSIGHRILFLKRKQANT